MATTKAIGKSIDILRLDKTPIRGEFSKDYDWSFYSKTKKQQMSYTMATFLASDGLEYMIFPNMLKFDDGKAHDTETEKGIFEISASEDKKFFIVKPI